MFTVCVNHPLESFYGRFSCYCHTTELLAGAPSASPKSPIYPEATSTVHLMVIHNMAARFICGFSLLSLNLHNILVKL